MLDDMTLYNAADFEMADWYEIDTGEIDMRYLSALRAKPNLRGKYQAGVKIAFARWRWSIKNFDTAAEAESAAVAKVAELKRMKNEKR